MPDTGRDAPPRVAEEILRNPNDTLYGLTVSVVVFVTPFDFAEIVTFWVATTATVVTPKFAAVCPARTLTASGVVTNVLLSRSETQRPPLGGVRIKTMCSRRVGAVAS